MAVVVIATLESAKEILNKSGFERDAFQAVRKCGKIMASLRNPAGT